MHKAWVLLWLLLMATTVRGAEWPDLDHLNWDDPVWYSGDGETWYTANFLMQYIGPDCTSGGLDDSGFPVPADCSAKKTQVGLVWYEKPLHPEGMEIAYLRTTPDDAETPKPAPDPEPVPDPDPIPYPEPVPDPLPETPVDGPSKAELYGLLTRLENLINTTDPRAAFGTAANMMSDRESLQLRIDALREVLRNDK